MVNTAGFHAIGPGIDSGENPESYFWMNRRVFKELKFLALHNCYNIEGLSDETKSRGPLYLSVYTRASKRSHTGGQ